MRKARIYIASPYTIGNQADNVRAAMDLWDRLRTLGYAPYCPLWSHFQHLVFPRAYEDWLAHDLEWLRVCDLVIRIPGKSSGADKEVAEARRLGIPVIGDPNYPEPEFSTIVNPRSSCGLTMARMVYDRIKPDIEDAPPSGST